jgi:hypothetical protein
MTRKLALLIFFVVLNNAGVNAQISCPNATMICAVPNVYSTESLPSNLSGTVVNNFSFGENAAALNATVGALGTELTDLPLASPASGIIFILDSSLGVVTRSTEGYGPILTDRAETIGRHRLFVATTYQFFQFGSLDGISLKSLPGAYINRNLNQNPPAVAPAPDQDYITTTTRVDLKVHQVTFYATYGLTGRIDISAAIPVLDVRLGISSNANIVRVAPQPVAVGTPMTDLGYFYYFDKNNPASSVNATFSWFNTARGIGDVIFRAKGTVFDGERAKLALGTEVRVPSGDEKNFLGSGAAGVKPFVTASYSARFSPHVNLGYEFNGSSILAGSPVGKEARLADEFFYSGGTDIGISKRVTGAVDLWGERLFGANRVVQRPFVDALGNSPPNVLQLVPTRGSFNIDNLSVGGKYSPFGNFLCTANLQYALDSGGLRAKVVPMVGVAYAF